VASECHGGDHPDLDTGAREFADPVAERHVLDPAGVVEPRDTAGGPLPAVALPGEGGGDGEHRGDAAAAADQQHVGRACVREGDLPDGVPEEQSHPGSGLGPQVFGDHAPRMPADGDRRQAVGPRGGVHRGVVTAVDDAVDHHADLESGSGGGPVDPGREPERDDGDVGDGPVDGDDRRAGRVVGPAHSE
jgi:hypothetical protein